MGGKWGGRKKEVKSGKEEGERNKLYLSCRVWLTLCHSSVVLCHAVVLFLRTLRPDPSRCCGR